MSRLLATAAMAALLLTGAAVPQALAQDAAATPAAAPAEPAPEPDHLAAAVDFLNTSGATKGFEDMIPQFIDQGRLRFVTQRPELEGIINEASLALVPEIVKERNTLTARLALLYTKEFTADELKQIAAFYHTPVGQKLASNQVKILEASVPVVQSWSRDLTGLITKRIKEEVAKKGQKL